MMTATSVSRRRATLCEPWLHYLCEPWLHYPL